MTLDAIAREAPAHRPAAVEASGGLATSVGKALAVLAAFGGDGVLLGVTQVAARAGIPKSTAHRILAVLVEHGYVERDDTRYQLSRRMFELGNQVADCRPRSLRSSAAPFLSNLYEESHATVHLAVLDGLDVLYVDKIWGHRSVHVPSQIGGRTPALCTALGKAILAVSKEETQIHVLSQPIPRLTPRTVLNRNLLIDSLKTTRQTGIAQDFEGVKLGVRCIAAPIVQRGTPIGAISMSLDATARIPKRAEDLLVQAVRKIGAIQ
ncbi:MAG: IclR family transcriptional regulator [Nocardioides sp.]|uniref:IclR family transcriptional regulator n=1 Tax=Nocardioides sp. TaxID=35761 RepID=UPI0039E3F3A4